MKKIHQNEERPRRRRLSVLGKIALAAAIIASLAIPVMAATGFHFTEWLEDALDKRTDYDNDLRIGSKSQKWEVSGWLMEVAAEEASSTGLTLVCTEWGNQEREGTLTVGENFWLEKWNGSGYDTITPAAEMSPSEETQYVQQNATTTWNVNWESSYGKLESGSYRLGKTFTHTSDSGQTTDLIFYAKFRVFAEEMVPYIETCKNAMDALRQQETAHLTFAVYPDEEEYDHYTQEIWRNGDDYLEVMTYIQADGAIWKCRGYMLRDGIGYRLNWTENRVDSQISAWERTDYVDSDNFEMWYSSLRLIDAQIGEVYADGNVISILEDHKWFSETYYTEESFTMNAQGGLAAITYTKMPELECDDGLKELQFSLEVHDTSAADIAAVINSQDLTAIPSFSWQEEQAMYPDGKTDGFVNTAPRTITNAADAIAAAKAECTEPAYYDPDTGIADDFNVITVYYDEAAQMWKVEFTASWDPRPYFAVYMDAQGITQLTVSLEREV